MSGHTVCRGTGPVPIPTNSCSDSDGSESSPEPKPDITSLLPPSIKQRKRKKKERDYHVGVIPTAVEVVGGAAMLEDERACDNGP